VWGALRRRRSLVALIGLVLLALFWFRGRTGADAGSLQASLGRVLSERGLELERGTLHWVRPEQGLPASYRPALFIAGRPDEPTDLFYAEVRATSGGAVLGLRWLTNVTRTSSAAEHSPVRSGSHLLYGSRVGEGSDAVVLLDMKGEPDSLTADWPWRARIQNHITNLQETGRWEGFGRRRYVLDPPASELALRAEDGRFHVKTKKFRVVLDPEQLEPVKGAKHVQARPIQKAQPGTITWLVNTVRDLSFVGPEPIAWLEHRVFKLKDLFQRSYHSAADAAGAEEDTEAEVAEDMGVTVEESRRRLALSATDPEIDWPPPALDPVLKRVEKVRGEGEWLPVVDDPFVESYPNSPPAFYQTFLRVDPKRLYVRVYIVLWDPRQVQLRMMTGTEEPKSATGETGPGMVPRDEETMNRLVGAFNGGFQATHGEFGMMSSGRVYLPPKPWAATIAVYDNGRVKMGSWLPPPEGVRNYYSKWAIDQIPDGMVEYRQNLTSVVEDGTYNPWERWYWGAAPKNAESQTYIDRSGVCLTERGYFAYFWGRSMGPKQLGKAMLAARCVRGMHLDMNLRHTGFEFYNVEPKGEQEPLEKDLTSSQYEGPVPHTDGEYQVRAREAVKSMAPRRFPRYLRRDPRDFFYLMLKPTLPGPHLQAGASAPEGAGKFSTEGLPHAGWPHAFARTFLGGSEGKRTWLVRIDPRRTVFGPMSRRSNTGRVLGYLTQGARLARRRGPVALYAIDETVGWKYGMGEPPEGAKILVSGKPVEPGTKAGAALGVDRNGFLVYAERQPDEAVGLHERLQQAGAAKAIALPPGVRLAFSLDGKHVAPDAYEREVELARAMPIFARRQPMQGEVLFPDVEPRPYAVWARLQDARVRYFKDDDGEPRFRRPDLKEDEKGKGTEGGDP
jgi:hypothetical protein